MKGLLFEIQGEAAARSFYEGSVLRSVLWSRLLSMSTSTEMSERILELRGKLSASVNQEGKIVLDLRALNDHDRDAIDDAKLISTMLREFEPQPASESNSSKEQAHNAVAVQRLVEDLLSQVRRTGRQEERVALLMSAILSDPAVGKSALLQIQGDRAKTATWAINELRKLVIDTKWSSDEPVIAAMIPQLYTQQWPMTRGDLLLFLAKHLGKWPQVNAAIREVLSRTRSIYVGWSRKEIEDALESRSAGSKP